MNIGGKHKSIALFGYPVEHTLSPMIHNTVIESMGLPYVYVPFTVNPNDLYEATRGICAMGFAGTNITIPHKSEVIKYLDYVDKKALDIGAVNTVVISDGKMKGYNTDGEGFIRSLIREGVEIEGKEVALLGAGGAARAIIPAIADKKAKSIKIISRNKEKSESICERVEIAGVGDVEDLKNADIVINATPQGMYPNTNTTPIENIEILKIDAVVVDLVYNPRQTRFLKEASEKGHKTVNGLGMLIFQAMLAFEKFTGKKPDEATVEKIFSMLSLSENIVLTGFMGTGKSSVGKTLSHMLATKFVDIDMQIVEHEGMEISEIFKTKGEQYFRDLERQIILETAKDTGNIISLGGGAVLNPDTIDKLKENSCVIRLNASINKILKNVKGDTNRPLLNGKTKEETEKLLSDREIYYKNCHDQVNIDGLSVSQVADKVFEKYYRFKEGLR